MKKTNEYIGSLTDMQVAELIKDVQIIMQGSGNVDTGGIVDLLFDPLETSLVVKARIAIFTQIVMKNLREMR